ncbi:hypothetical protein [Calothrix sp. 336/3]|uniref:hypothetical protein n=1 Tax=Calothrix sp. 336/3 TaxID=1337936 RepID=UPI0004E36EC8|nr:hypothetical protein [Calothrix sp. 336/3]AKG24328.1 hypothetical protein IJ00_26100 [Calothrix sp. 336/3]
MDCKALIYQIGKQQVIAPIYPNYLVKWDISQEPRIIQQIELPYKFEPVPSIVLLPDGERFAVTPSEVTPEFGIEIRHWDDLSVLQTVQLPHAPYGETSLEDEYHGHQKCTHISWLGVTPCQRYLLIAEGWGDMYLVNLETGEQVRWLCRWRDYNAGFAMDAQMQFLIINSVDMDEFHHVFRIGDMLRGELSYLGEFAGGARCHRGGLGFSPDGESLAYSFYIYNRVELACLQVDRQFLASLNDFVEQPLETKWQQPWMLHHGHDSFNPWQSEIVWLDNQRLVFGVGKTLALVQAETGEVEATYNLDAVMNGMKFDPISGKMIVATKEGIGVVTIG